MHNIPVQLWSVFLDQDATAVHKLYNLLNDEERLRAAKFKFDRDRIRWVVSRASLRIALGQWLNFPPAEIELSITDTGKPFVAQTPISFNLSHSENFTLIVITADEPVGVDIEPLNRGKELLTCTAEFLHPDEQALLEKDDIDKSRFLIRTWCAKEAYLKATGTGLNIILTSLRVDWPPNGTALLSYEGKPDPFFRIHFPQPRTMSMFCAAVALPKKFTCPEIVFLDPFV
ncbi:MAG: 4'-phosphopantetheinyl transferase superfamily protein [Chthoniobacterales bacterium]